jgi:hypothetical protein
MIALKWRAGKGTKLLKSADINDIEHFPCGKVTYFAGLIRHFS